MNLFGNFLILAAWHYFVLIFVSRINYKFYYRECCQLDVQFFKKREKFYENFWKIKKWKDLIPQYVDKAGFSKKNIVSLKPEYIKKFIAETYKAELDHVLCCFVIPFMFFLNSLKVSVFISFLVFIVNFPCVLIQRYNRLRLKHLLIKLNKNKKIIRCNLVEG